MSSIGLFFKKEDERICETVAGLIEQMEDEDYKLIMTREHAKVLERKDLGVSDTQLAAKSKFILTLGGDGTVLHASHFAARHNLEILGINLGKLGFLTEARKDDLLDILSQVFKGKYYLDQRMMIEADVIRHKKRIGEIEALNDMVISKCGIARILRMHIYVNEHLMSEYAADGVIVATPSGSTAYNLSAMGPILTPNAKAVIVSAICPHSLSDRSVVLGVEDKIKIVITEAKEGVILTADGQEIIPLAKGDQILINKSKHMTKFIRLKPFNFFDVLREKLGWGGE